ncbi:helix-turn-helix transcriptional regulator [Dactylosporangium sp. NPDC049742]|uniref:helix-turn-helix transcriptional regulator n=1 Tax=Dactylosporangium sp. NPDC049742 TaxID=3154737 RepID=UPI00342C9241
MPGRPETPIDPTAGPIEKFAFDLRERRESAGRPTYRTMAAVARYSPAALSQAAAGRRLPTWDLTRAFLTACNVSDQEMRRWKQNWEAINRQIRPTGDAPWSGITVINPHPSAERLLTYVTDLEGYREALSALRREQRLTLRQLEERSLGRLSKSTASDMVTGKLMLRPEFVELYLTVCGLQPTEVENWIHVLRRLTNQYKRAQAALRMLTIDEPATNSNAVQRLEPTMSASRSTQRGGSHRRASFINVLFPWRNQRKSEEGPPVA